MSGSISIRRDAVPQWAIDRQKALKALALAEAAQRAANNAVAAANQAVRDADTAKDAWIASAVATAGAIVDEADVAKS